MPEVVRQLEEPLIKLKHRLAESYVGRRLGISYAEVLGDTQKWAEYLDQINKHPLRISLIIAGFIGRDPVLLETAYTDGDELPRLEWVTHFAVIGSGAWVATPSLHMREQDRNAPLAKTLYQVYEAKRQAEIAPSVGKSVTRMFVIRPRGSTKMLAVDVVTTEGMNELEQLYRQYGPKPVPRLPALDPTCFSTAHFSDPEGRRDPRRSRRGQKRRPPSRG